MPASIFSGSTVKFLKKILDLNGGAQIISSTTNPSSTAVSAPAGSLLLNETSGSLYRKTDAGSSTNWTLVGSGGTTNYITQSSHGFVVGDVLYYTGSTYAKAKADADSTSEVVGVVSEVTTTDKFILTSAGFVSGLSGLTAGSTYFLSSTSAGAITTTEPTTTGYVSKPVLLAVSTTTGYVVQHRGAVIGGGNGGITAWQSFTPVGTWTSNTTYAGKWRRVGENGEYHIIVSVNGSPTAANLQVDLPSGHVIDTNKLAGSGSDYIINGVCRYNHTTANYVGGGINYIDTNTIQPMRVGQDTSHLAQPIDNSNLFSSGDKVQMFFTVPIVGF
jgi:hypothetical protein